nr:MAG TPA: hypothetical protein [Caudoviricetes sp.]
MLLLLLLFQTYIVKYFKICHMMQKILHRMTNS